MRTKPEQDLGISSTPLNRIDGAPNVTDQAPSNGAGSLEEEELGLVPIRRETRDQVKKNVLRPPDVQRRNDKGDSGSFHGFEDVRRTGRGLGSW